MHIIQASSRNLENLSDSLDFLNIRDLGRFLNQNFSGSRILRNSNPQLTLRKEFLNSGMTKEK
jgi:hypothetical protein